LKKVRINLRRGIKSWSFVLYDSAESAYFLKDEPVYVPDSEEEYRKVVVLRPGEVIEAEWIGAEWVYTDETTPGFDVPADMKHDKFDRVRLGKLSVLKGKDVSGDTNYLEIYSGWLPAESLPWREDRAPSQVKVTEIKGRTKSKLDFTKLFRGTSLEEEELIEERKMTSDEPIVLN
jgi:hypothetical protein